MERALVGADPLPCHSSVPISLDQYTSLVASLEVFADKRELILSRYGIAGEGEYARIEALLHAQLASDPPLRARFDARRAATVERLRRG